MGGQCCVVSIAFLTRDKQTALANHVGPRHGKPLASSGAVFGPAVLRRHSAQSICKCHPSLAVWLCDSRTSCDKAPIAVMAVCPPRWSSLWIVELTWVVTASSHSSGANEPPDTQACGFLPCTTACTSSEGTGTSEKSTVVERSRQPSVRPASVVLAMTAAMVVPQVIPAH